MAKIYDCFTYYNEDLLLSLRLETLNEVVDTFVVVEATHTFSGKPKPLFFDPNRFAKFSNKISYVVVDDMPLELGNAWANEAHQRNAILRGLTDAAPNDWIMISDADEIPNPGAILQYRPWHLYGTFIQKLYNYFLNNLAVKDLSSLKPCLTTRARITTMGHLKRFFRTPQNLRFYKAPPGFGGLFEHLHRNLRHQRLEHGGWHFSWLMTPEQMIEKIESFSHTEVNKPHIKSIDAIRKAIIEGRDILGKGEHFQIVKLDDTFPKYILNNLELFRGWILNSEDTTK